jgi:hypothetical protein
MAELVDAQVSGTCAARRGGSSPLLGTIPFLDRPTWSEKYPKKLGFPGFLLFAILLHREFLLVILNGTSPDTNNGAEGRHREILRAPSRPRRRGDGGGLHIPATSLSAHMLILRIARPIKSAHI